MRKDSFVFGYILCQNIDVGSGFTRGKSAKRNPLALVSQKQPDLSGNGCTTDLPQCIAKPIEQETQRKTDDNCQGKRIYFIQVNIVFQQPENQYKYCKIHARGH